jgi:hypothetical protein
MAARRGREKGRESAVRTFAKEVAEDWADTISEIEKGTITPENRQIFLSFLHDSGISLAEVQSHLKSMSLIKGAK